MHIVGDEVGVSTSSDLSVALAEARKRLKLIIRPDVESRPQPRLPEVDEERKQAVQRLEKITGLRIFCLRDLEMATAGFHRNAQVGSGGFGSVFRLYLYSR